MANIDSGFLQIGRMDTLAQGKTWLHRLDPRAKLIAVSVFIVTVVSFDKYTLSALIPFFVFPAILVGAGGLPVRFLMARVLMVAPFAFFIGIFNPLLDRQTFFQMGTIAVSGGWISFGSIMIRFVLTITTVLALIALSGFNGVCLAMEKLGAPKPFVVQLLFLYRYLFVLTDEAIRMVRARSLRAFHSKTMGIKTFASLVGHLLLRALDRAQRIHLAMCCRGFDGRVPMIKPMGLDWKAVAFTVGWCGLFILLRFYNLPLKLGALVTGWVG